MKRGFEENVPKVRPRVRMGRALDEQFEEAQQVAAAESAEPAVAGGEAQQVAAAESAEPAVAGGEAQAAPHPQPAPVPQPEKPRPALAPAPDPEPLREDSLQSSPKGGRRGRERGGGRGK